MALQLSNHTINSASIIDDDPGARQEYSDYIEDLDLEPRSEEGPLTDIDIFIGEMLRHSQAAICDYRMAPRGYAAFNGAELVSRCYKKRFPILLFTRFEGDSFSEILPYRKKIPVLLRPDQVNPDSIRRGWEVFLNECDDKFLPSRRAWRTLVRIEDVDVDRGVCYFILPSWNPHHGLHLHLRDLEPEVRRHVKPGARLIAWVNIGAESPEDLYFDHWEEASP